MAGQINSAEVWKKTYEAFQQINFSAWDYNTIKKSLIDNLKTYYPEEDFNDYIESSELISIIETFAYVAELLAYRYDMNAHENIDAERKESVLRAVKLISYSASRNIPARGLVKINSISTTEKVFDSKGNELTNKTIKWDDKNNPNWKDQFILIMNKVFEQSFGTVLPNDRVQVQDILFELYGLNNIPTNNSVFSYNANVSDKTYPMELVPCSLNDYGPYEKRPEKNLKMNVLYLSDGLGDSSENTGFFFLTKQGKLQRTTTNFDGITPNQIFDINVKNSNETDVWVNNIDSTTGKIIVGNGNTSLKEGEWVNVDVANSQNIIFNTNPNRNKYEIETLVDDQIRLIFGDGNFANIPSGLFEIWTRTSANEDYVIPTTAIQNISSNFDYYDADNKVQTIKLSFSLNNAIQNAAPSEDIEHIKRISPSVYYTQDRMVNGPDYNEFMLQDNSILKLRSINRTFAGDSKYIAWHDPSEYYDNVKMFSDDGILYFDSFEEQERIPSSDLPRPDYVANTLLVNALINNYIQPLLSTENFYTKSILKGTIPSLIRNIFTNKEKLDLGTYLRNTINNPPQTVWMTFDPNSNKWSFSNTKYIDWWISIELSQDDSWYLTFNATKIILHSNSLDFWNSNNNLKTITYDTNSGDYDQIYVLAANTTPDNDILTKNYALDVLKQDIHQYGANKGDYSLHDLILLPADENGDGVPDNITLSYLINENNFVYFNRACINCEWTWVPLSNDTISKYNADKQAGTQLWKRELGRENINFLWMHRTPRYHLVDPASSNIIDTYIITRGYYQNIKQWLENKISGKPEAPKPYELRSQYNYLLESKMISDTVILHNGKIKIIFGNKADPQLQASFKVIRSDNKTLSNNQLKASIVDSIISYFDITRWEFGQTFYFTDLASYIKSQMPSDIKSIVLVPNNSNHYFGDLFQITAADDEIIQPNIDVNNIDIVESFDASILKQF